MKTFRFIEMAAPTGSTGAKGAERDRAIALLEKLLATSYGRWSGIGPLTPAILRLDPMFDPLRNDPRFQNLCQKSYK